MTNMERYRGIFRNVFNVEDDVLNDSFTFKDTDIWDSMSHITLISELEEAFNVMFKTEDILHYGSFSHGIEILTSYGVDFGE